MDSGQNNLQLVCEACRTHLQAGQNQVGKGLWATHFRGTPASTLRLNDPGAVVYLCKSCTCQGFLFENGEVCIWPKSRADIAQNPHPRSTNTYNPWTVQPTDLVFCNHHYHADCSCCWLGHEHTWARHYQSLLHFALRQRFGDRWQWTREKEDEMFAFEREWWTIHVPFPYNERRDRQTPSW